MGANNRETKGLNYGEDVRINNCINIGTKGEVDGNIDSNKYRSKDGKD